MLAIFEREAYWTINIVTARTKSKVGRTNYEGVSNAKTSIEVDERDKASTRRQQLLSPKRE